MNKQVLNFLFPLAAFVAMANPASAVSVSYSNSFSGLLPSGSTNITINKFNPTQGTLNSINVSLGGTSNFVINATNLAYPSAAAPAIVTASENLNLQLNSFIFNTSPTATSSTVSVPGDSNVTLPAFTGTTSSSQAASAASFADFTGTGLLSFTLSADALGLTPTGSSSPDVFYLNDSSSSTSTLGTVSVQYEYTPVPEPAFTGAMILSVGGLFVMKRRFRKVAKINAPDKIRQQ